MLAKASTNCNRHIVKKVYPQPKETSSPNFIPATPAPISARGQAVGKIVRDRKRRLA